MKTLDLRGLKCPLPVLKTRRLLATLAPGEQVEVACTDPLSAIDLPNLVRETGDILESQSQDGSAFVFTIRRAGSMKERATLAAIVYQENDAIDDLLAQARDKIAAAGYRIGGIMQDPCGETIHVTLLDSGRRINITQELGACAEGCRLDTSALAEAAGLLAESLRDPPDLLLIARFGRVELEGGGFLAEIAEAASAGIPTLVGVADTREEGWRAFAGEFAESLPCTLDAVLDWWTAVAPKH